MKQLSNVTIVLLTISISMLVFLCVATYLTLTAKNPGTGNCLSLKDKKDVMWNDDCSAIIENKFDGTMKQPSKPLYLVNFRNSTSFGKALGANVWYRYRYVDGKTGNYSKFSPWTQSPIIAGGKNLPCKDGDCSNVDAGKNNKNYCKSNLVELGIDDLDYTLQSGVYANVHRYASKNAEPPSDDLKNDKIVGYLFSSGANSWKFIDVSESVCKEMTCNRHTC